jgi:phage repressor protein C with HTH and peptisase S24 domain
MERVWDMSNMSATDALRGSALYDRLMALKPKGLVETDWAELAGVNRSFFSNLKGKNTSPRADTLRKVLAHVGRTEADLYGEPTQTKRPARLDDDDIEMVGIRMIDMSYGLGATYAVDYPEIDILRFPKQWIEVITHSPPAMLTWARGKGDSMEPTIRDGDLVLLDQSQRALTERDAMWAFTIGEEAAIKRLRRQGDRCQIFSDNPAVPPDEQMLRDINIVGRVVFVGSRK